MHTDVFTVCNSWSVVARSEWSGGDSRDLANEVRQKASLPFIWRPMGVTGKGYV